MIIDYSLLQGPDYYRGKATRGDGLHLVPSQATERIQAEDVPEVWPSDSPVDRIAARPWFGVLVFAVIVAVVVGGFLWAIENDPGVGR